MGKPPGLEGRVSVDRDNSPVGVEGRVSRVAAVQTKDEAEAVGQNVVVEVHGQEEEEEHRNHTG